MNNRILLLLSNLNSQFGNTLLTTQHMEEPEESLPSWPACVESLESSGWKGKLESWKAGKPGKPESGRYDTWSVSWIYCSLILHSIF